MGFEEFLPVDENEEAEESDAEELIDSVENERNEKIGQTQVYDIITSRKPDWQSIIFELISSEQLDPWDIDIVVLTNGYFKKILEIEEMQKKEGLDAEDEINLDFYISSKVLLAAALLLRIKSEFLLNKHIRGIDEILFGKKEENKYVMERIEINEDELPMLIPKTPMSRLRRVTLSELMTALNQAIETETRRIKREVAIKRAKKLSEVDFPTFKRIDLKDRIKQFYARILTSIRKKQLNEKNPEKHFNKLGFHNLAGSEKEEKLACFLPLLHLSNSQKLWLEQEKHLDEIWIYLYEYFDNNRDLFIKVIEEMEDSDFCGEELGGEMLVGETEEAIRAVEKEIEEISKEEKIDEITGFSDEN
jgi:chromatin segregation and condensation protein Rec8/ScpA/Scc1 (kleisin family)